MSGQAPSALADTVLSRLVDQFGAAGDPDRAPSMTAYMRDKFPFLGIAAPRQRVLARAVLTGLARPDEPDLRAVAVGCWGLAEREYQYFACGYLRRYAKRCSPGFADTARYLITTKSWWDTVDTLAAHLVGTMVSVHPELVTLMDEWIADPDIWLVRTALLHQLTYRESTDPERLFRYCARQAGHREFFVRKAIGWALRQYAWAEPQAVRGFVNEYRSRLSPLSVREALKNIG